jgi:DNA-binding NarL/FixJ family response regulator
MDGGSGDLASGRRGPHIGRRRPFVRWVEADLKRIGSRSGRRTARASLELTDRERDVAVLVAKGYSNPEVASEPYVSRKAIEYHLRNIYGKLGLTSRREL